MKEWVEVFHQNIEGSVRHDESSKIDVHDGHLFVGNELGVTAIYAPGNWTSTTSNREQIE
jgi:hypothetical protein